MYKIKTRARFLFILPIIGILILVSIFVTSCALPDELDQSNIINQFFPNFWVFLAHIIALIILLISIVAFVWKPTKRIITERTMLIQKSIDDTKEAQRLAELYLKEANQKRLNATSEAKKIIDNSINEGYKIRSELEEKAKRNADLIIQDTKRELIRKENKLRSEIHNEIINIALTTTEALTKKIISKSDNEKFIEDFIAKLEEIHIE